MKGTTSMKESELTRLTIELHVHLPYFEFRIVFSARIFTARNRQKKDPNIYEATEK
jgi:hypothetical protein